MVNQLFSGCLANLLKAVSQNRTTSLPPPAPAAVPHAVADAAPTTEHDLWHTVSAFALVLGVVSTEWVLRRQWGLR